MTISMTAPPGAVHSPVDRLLSTVADKLGSVPKGEQFEPIDAVRLLALHARRQHRMDLAAANVTLRAAVESLGTPLKATTPASVVRRIELHHRRSLALSGVKGGLR